MSKNALGKAVLAWLVYQLFFEEIELYLKARVYVDEYGFAET